MSTTIDIIKNASQDSRMKFHQTFAQLKEQDGADFIYQQYFQSGYEDICLGQGPWVLIPEEIEAQLIKTIDSDSIDELRELMVKQLEEQNGIKGLVQLRVNPILRCLEKGSLRCLQEITKRFSRGLREAMVGEKTKSKVQIGDNTYQFDNQAFAIMAANPNTQLLPFLLNQDGFIPTHRDLHNIILAYATPSADFEYLKKSQASLKLLLQSYRTHVVYASFSQNERKSLLRDLLKANSDPKLPSSQFLLDLITQRPYLKDSFSLILTQSEDIHPDIIHKIATQSEQSLSTQDFYIAEYLLERGKIDESFIPSHIQEAQATALRSLIKKLNNA